jgi:hypothetical protein
MADGSRAIPTTSRLPAISSFYFLKALNRSREIFVVNRNAKQIRVL